MRNKLRLATWIVCLLAIMVSFACVITAANNIVENNAKVIFISGTGDDANSGLSPKQAVRHLQKATELLNGAGGTIPIHTMAERILQTITTSMEQPICLLLDLAPQCG